MRVPNEQGNLGRYDEECTKLIKEFEARGVLLIVLDGKRGTGFSMSTGDINLATAVPRILRQVADDIERQNKKAAGN